MLIREELMDVVSLFVWFFPLFTLFSLCLRELSVTRRLMSPGGFCYSQANVSGNGQVLAGSIVTAEESITIICSLGLFFLAIEDL